MDTVGELIKQRIKYAVTLATRAEKYIDVIKDIVSGINPQEYKSCMAAIDRLKNTESIIMSLFGGDSIFISMKNVYNELLSVDEAMTTLLKTLTNETYFKMAMHNMSATYVMNVHTERNAAIDLHEKFLEVSVLDDEKIFADVFTELKAASNPTPAIAFIMDNETEINKFTIRLIGMVIKSVSGERKRRLELIIEKQKDIVLGSTRVDISKYVGVQGLLVRYGLRPLTVSMPIGELFGKLNLAYNSKLSLDENCKNAGAGIIVVNISNNSPIEFDLRGLIDNEYITANDYKTSQVSGLTKKIIDRFSTTKFLPRAGSAGKTLIYPSKGPWYILQTINGELYRALGKDTTAVAPDTIVGLINGLSTRPNQYNLAHSADILGKCFDPHAQLILDSYAEAKQSVASSEPTKAAIVERMREWFTKQIHDKKPQSAREVKLHAVNTQIITEILLDILTHTTGTHGKGSAEYIITYISKFDAIIYKFIKELERRWGEEQIADRVFKERSGADLEKYILDVHDGVVKLAVNELDKSLAWSEYDTSLKEYFLERKQVIV